MLSSKWAGRALVLAVAVTMAGCEVRLRSGPVDVVDDAATDEGAAQPPVREAFRVPGCIGYEPLFTGAARASYFVVCDDLHRVGVR